MKYLGVSELDLHVLSVSLYVYLIGILCIKAEAPWFCESFKIRSKIIMSYFLQVFVVPFKSFLILKCEVTWKYHNYFLSILFGLWCKCFLNFKVGSIKFVSSFLSLVYVLLLLCSLYILYLSFNRSNQHM